MCEEGNSSLSWWFDLYFIHREIRDYLSGMCFATFRFAFDVVKYRPNRLEEPLDNPHSQLPSRTKTNDMSNRNVYVIEI